MTSTVAFMVLTLLAKSVGAAGSGCLYLYD